MTLAGEVTLKSALNMPQTDLPEAVLYTETIS
jgi:hypothetical protein